MLEVTLKFETHRMPDGTVQVLDKDEYVLAHGFNFFDAKVKLYNKLAINEFVKEENWSIKGTGERQ